MGRKPHDVVSLVYLLQAVVVIVVVAVDVDVVAALFSLARVVFVETHLFLLEHQHFV